MTTAVPLSGLLQPRCTPTVAVVKGTRTRGRTLRPDDGRRAGIPTPSAEGNRLTAGIGTDPSVQRAGRDHVSGSRERWTSNSTLGDVGVAFNVFADEAAMVAMEAEIAKEVDEAVKFTNASPYPEVKTAFADLYTDAYEMEAVQ